MQDTTTGHGLLFIIVGPGGVGKNALMKNVLERIDNLTQLPTVTTRDPREGEIHGLHRFFVTLDEFIHKINHHELVEYEEVHPGQFYGTPRNLIENAIEENRYLIADIEFVGAQNIRAAYPDNVIIVFVKPTSLDVLVQRMRERGEDEAGILKRMARAEKEIQFESESDMIITNDDFDTAADQLYDFIRSQQKKQQKLSQNVAEVAHVGAGIGIANPVADHVAK